MRFLSQVVAVTALTLRTLPQRAGSSAVAVVGVTGVVIVFVAVLSIAEGFLAALAGAGSPDTAIVLRGGSTAETTSALATDATRIIKGLHLASDEGVTTILYLYFWRESAINLAWPMNAHMPSTTTVTNGIATTTKRSRGCGRWRRARHVNGIRCSVSTIGCNVSTIGCDVRTIG